MNCKKIVFEIGDENRPKIERISMSVLSESIFAEQYKHILRAIDRYCQYSKEINKTNSNQAGNINNIFTFIGDRGSGKTSCMLSVGDTIVNPDEEVVQNLKLRGLKDNRFLALDMIDPSFFDNKHNILAIVVAKLYSKYRQLKEESDRANIDLDHKKHLLLLNKFADIQRDLLCLDHSQNPDDDNLNQLYQLAAAVSLKENIQELITAFFDFFNKKGDQLLLIIDDIDLNTQCADVMAEQIRKYFVQPNVLILMSLKLSQFELIKRMTFKSDYNALLNHSSIAAETEMSHSDLNEMVERYMTKLLPHAQRTYMPESEDYMNLRLIINSKHSDTVEFRYVKEAIPALIFKKTRYLFYNSPQQVSYIVPRNLRELRQLVSMLYELDDYWDEDSDDGDEKKSHANTYNKELFLNYLFDNWCVSNLDLSDRKIVAFIESVEDLSMLNASIIDVLKNRFSSFFESNDPYLAQEGINQELRAIMSERNRTYNYSIGDTLTILYLLKSRHTEEKHLKFIFILLTILSIRLYESYDMYTDELISRTNMTDNEKNHQNVLSVTDNSILKGISEYHKLVGGKFFNNRIIDLLPKTERSWSRSNRRLPLAAINALIELGFETNDAQIIKLAEFFMLCTSRRFETRHSSGSSFNYDFDYRRRSEISYASSFGNSGSVLFDINAFFYNVTDVESCYSRFEKGGEFFRKIKDREWKDSIYSDFLKFTLKYRSNIDNPTEEQILNCPIEKWASLASLRNAEIIIDLFGMLDNIDYKSGKDSIILAEFFSKVSNYSIELYSGKIPNYRVGYHYAQTMSDLLSNVGELFNYVYNDSRLESATRKNSFAHKIKEIYQSVKEDLEKLNEDKVLKGISPRKESRTYSFRKRLIERYHGSLSEEDYENIIDSCLKNYQDKITDEQRREIIKKINSELIAARILFE